jgi:hypothetical protein
VVTKAGEIPTLGTFDINSKGIDVANALKRYPITCFAGQASGRQTFIQIGCKPVACLFQDLSGTLRDDSGSVSPNNSIVEHILLQSCHSPFVWPDFGGNYLSVPLAFLFGTITRTFITSTRVQSLIPGLVPLYFHLASKGRTAGEIVVALNALAGNRGAIRIDRASRRSVCHFQEWRSSDVPWSDQLVGATSAAMDWLKCG